MTDEQFNAWAYTRLQAYLEDTVPSVIERPGFVRVAAFVQALEGDRAVLVKNDPAQSD